MATNKDKEYRRISYTETGGEKNPFIRTRVNPKGGSTAFGPVQITNRLAKDYVNRKKMSEESAKYYNEELKPLYDNFIKHGANKGKIKDYDADYDYGGSGKFDAKKSGAKYEAFAKELIEHKLKESKGDEKKFIKSWRGKGEKDDPKYYKRYQEAKDTEALEEELLK